MRTIGSAAIVLMLGIPCLAQPAEVDAYLRQIGAVGREGAGNVAASKAWRELVQLGPDALVPTLTALDGADPTAANWLRTAVDAIAEQALAAGRKLPADKLEAFIQQTEHAGPARRLAYEWLTKVDPKAPDRLLPGMLNDPSIELRRDAVARVLQEAKQLLDKGDKDTATAAYRRAFTGARDRDQVQLIAKQLKTLGVEVDLPAHFGFIQQWLLVGPFDNTKKEGFQIAYQPEKGVDVHATYKGKNEVPLLWKPYTTPDPYGLVDLNKALGKNMGVVAYAFAAVSTPVDRAVEIRVGSNNAIKIFLNGQEIFFREEYHHGMRMDQHVGVAALKAGRNEILLKVCQNEQTEDWAQSWSFQCRICDHVGSAVPVTVAAAKTAQGDNQQ